MMVGSDHQTTTLDRSTVHATMEEGDPPARSLNINPLILTFLKVPPPPARSLNINPI